MQTFKSLLGAGIALAMLYSTADAQTAPAAAAGSGETEALTEIIVTGSRIAAPNAVSTSPIQVLNSQYIEQTGKTDISDLISQLPQISTNSLGQDLGNSTSGLTTAGGVATADLRGLGPNRTLVLVDGRRLGQGSPYTFIQSPAPDIDQIPSGLVERIEVVTGGASATYGSDAIAGVVNFIMKHDFQGIEFNAQYNENWHHQHDEIAQNLVRDFGGTPATGTVHDGRQRNFDVLMGTNFADGEGNVTAYLSYRHADPVYSSARDFGGCELYPVYQTIGGLKTQTGAQCGGSANSNLFEPQNGPNAGNDYSVLGNQFVPYGTAGTTPPAEFNSQPYITMTRGDDRYNGAVLAHMTVTDYFQPYTEFYFMDDKTHQAVAPAAAFFGANPLDGTGTGGYPVNCNNPLMSAQQQSTLCSPAMIAAANLAPNAPCTTDVTGALSANCVDVGIGRRNIEGGSRFADYEHTNYRAVLGSKGELLDGALTYDLYGQYYYTAFQTTVSKYFNFQALDNALNVVGTAAAPACQSGGSCVPYNIFSDNGVTQDQLNYLYINGLGVGSSTLRTLHAEMTAQLGKWGIKSPFANDGIAINGGFEHRNDHESFEPDYAQQQGLLSGAGSAAVSIDNGLTVKEGFLEARVPIAQDLPGVKDLLFDTAYRYSNYTSNGGVGNGEIGFQAHTYKFEIQYSPIKDVRIRGSYDKAIRAPSIVELYNPQLVGLVQSGDDPCAQSKNGTVAYSAAQCANLGVTAAQYAASVAGAAVGGVNPIPQCIAGQCSQLTGGNTGLQPEQAETYTVGVNFTPTWLPKFTASIDYWHINIAKEVGVLPVATIISQCAAGNQTYCGYVHRNPATGGLQGNNIADAGYIDQIDLNVGGALASGIDTQLAYTQDLPAGLGSLHFDANGSWLQHAKTSIEGTGSYECAGQFGFTCQTVNPRWHHIVRTTWNMPFDISASLTWRYIGAAHQDANSGNPLQANPNYDFDAFNARIPSFSYLDFTASWHPTKVLTLRAGINNFLDKDPPLLVAQTGIVSGGAANTDGTYDMFGRQVFVSMSAKF